MRVNRLDRVIILVRDLDRAMSFFSTKLGVEFVELEVGEAEGQRASMSLDHQMELISPILPVPESAPPATKRWVELLQDRESVFLALAFRVDDAAAAGSDAQRLGMRIVDTLNLPELPPLPIHDLKEVEISEEDTLGIPVILVEYHRG